MARLTVEPRKGGGWQVAGSAEPHAVRTQREGIAAARQRLGKLGGGELIVKGRDGQVRSQTMVRRPTRRARPFRSSAP
jgi:hypothetical protein